MTFHGTRNTRPLTPEERAERISRADAHVDQHLQKTRAWLAEVERLDAIRTAMNLATALHARGLITDERLAEYEAKAARYPSISMDDHTAEEALAKLVEAEDRR